MSDITVAAEQAEIADSILSAPVVGSWKDGALAEEPTAQEQETPAPAEEKLADLSTDRNDGQQISPEEAYVQLAAQVRANESGRTATEQQASQPEQRPTSPEPTAEQLRETVQALDGFNEQHQLHDDLRTKEFCLSLAELGQPLSQTNQAELGKGLDRLALSALQTAESTPGQFPVISRAAASELCFTLLPALGVDPRDPNVNQEYVATVLHDAAVNIHQTAQNTGSDDVRRINDPQAACGALWHLAKGFGLELEWPLTPEHRQMAVTMADGFAKYVLAYRSKVAANFHPESQRQSRAARGPARKQVFRTNSDLFDQDTLDRLDLEKATHKRGEDFSPKQKAPRSRFQTNQDVFSEDVMNEYDMRRL